MSWYVPPIFRRISWKKQPGNGWLPFSALLGCTPRWDPNWFLVTAALCAIFGVINLGHEIHFFCFVCFFEICFLNLNLQLQGVFCSLVREPFVVIFCCWLKFGSCWVKNSRPNGKRPRSLTKHDFDVPPKSCHWHVQRNMRCIERCIWWAWHEIPTCSCLNGGEQVLDGSSDLEVDQHWFTNIRFHFLSSFFSCLVVFSHFVWMVCRLGVFGRTFDFGSRKGSKRSRVQRWNSPIDPRGSESLKVIAVKQEDELHDLFKFSGISTATLKTAQIDDRHQDLHVFFGSKVSFQSLTNKAQPEKKHHPQKKHGKKHNSEQNQPSHPPQPKHSHKKKSCGILHKTHPAMRGYSRTNSLDPVLGWACDVCGEEYTDGCWSNWWPG